MKRLLLRLRGEDGFGLIELSMAMVMLNVGILAIVAAFQAGAVSLRRSSTVATASVIGDQQMEQFRRMRNCEITLDASAMPASGSYYAADTTAYANAGYGTPTTSPSYVGSYYSSARTPATQYWVTTYQPSSGADAWNDSWEAAFPPVGDSMDTRNGYGPSNQIYPECTNGSAMKVAPDQTVTGPDGASYVVDTYIYVVRVSGQGYQKQVTIVVRNPSDTAHALFRESSTFDPADSP